VCGLLKFREHHIKALHQTDFFTFEYLEPVSEVVLCVLDLAIDPEVVRDHLLARHGCSVDHIVRVQSASEL